MKAYKRKLIHRCLSSRIYILIIGSMLKRVHILTHLSPHKNTTKLTSIDMQVQIFESMGHRVPKSAVKCRLLRRNSSMVPLRGQDCR